MTTSEPPPEKATSWLKPTSSDVLKIVAGAAALAGLMLHLMGSAWHEAYLSAWGIDTALFPKGLDWFVIQGFERALLNGLQIWPKMLANLVAFSLLAIGVVLYWHCLNWVSRKIEAAETAPRWLLKLPWWIQSILVRLLLVVGVLLVAPAAIWALSIVLAVPIAIAQVDAKTQVKDQIVQFSKGCQSNGVTRCFELRRGTELIGRGLLIDGSPGNLAFFDVDAKRTRVVPRDGTEMQLEVPRAPSKD